MIYQFSSISLNTVSKQLLINGQKVDAEDRLIYLLIELISHYPEHCDKDYILTTIWPDTVVSEWSVSKLVSDARQLFKLHGYDHDIIQTVRGKGYRLNPELGEQLSITEAEKSSFPGKTPAKKNKNRLYLLIVSVLIAFLLSWGWMQFQLSHNPLVLSEPANSVGRLLWVDDNPDNNREEKRYLEQHNITVYQVTSTDQALTSLALYEYNAVISDMGRKGEVLAGLSLLKTMRKNHNQTPFFLYTIVLTDAQHQLMKQHQGQGVAVNAEQLYKLILPLYPPQADKAKVSNTDAL
ncbi:winged helix-turn-helix domain-containing protein [Neptunicella sp. SCSIO 80796]|uniref:winged helix-turn-helix domain-containing protein n=1 Tax=Neptunicella plasticusilytica TaxID=3117012 RepID=UPI003A4DC3CD